MCIVYVYILLYIFVDFLLNGVCVMIKQNIEIAQRIRALREDYGYSAEKMAELLSITIDAYKSLEKGQVDFSISFLEKISGVFNVELPILVTGDEPKLRVYDVTRKGEGLVVKRNEEYDYRALVPNFIGKKLMPFEVEVPLIDSGEPIHYNSHPGFEFEYIIEGELKIKINENEIILHKGDCVYFDSNCPHWMMSLGDTPAKVLVIIDV